MQVLTATATVPWPVPTPNGSVRLPQPLPAALPVAGLVWHVLQLQLLLLPTGSNFLLLCSLGAYFLLFTRLIESVHLQAKGQAEIQ